MVAERLTFSLPQEAVSTARRAAQKEGVSLSSWVASAMRGRAELAQTKEILDELIAESDPPTAEELAWMGAALSLARRANSSKADSAEEVRAA